MQFHLRFDARFGSIIRGGFMAGWLFIGWVTPHRSDSGRLLAEERQATPVSSITVQPGFEVQLIRSAQKDEGSWISMTFDQRGRVIVGIDDAGLGRLTIGSDPEISQFERLENTQVFRHVRGVLVANDSLYVCATDSQAVYRLWDTTGDDQYDHIEQLMEVDYRSRFGHGTNQIVPAPWNPPWGPGTNSLTQENPQNSYNRDLYLINGNDVSFPKGSDPNSPYRNPQNDWLLPSPHDAGHRSELSYRVSHGIRQSMVRAVPSSSLDG